VTITKLAEEPDESRVFLPEVQRLNLNPGDVIVLMAPKPVSSEWVARAMDVLRERLGHEVPILFLDSGVRMVAVNEADLGESFARAVRSVLGQGDDG
jgi:hypothetical protein